MSTMAETAGFSLVELLVYLAASSLMLMFVIHFCVNVQRTSTKKNAQSLARASIYASLDSMARECSCAPADQRLWYHKDTSMISWKTFDGTVGFSFNRTKLLRFSRSYAKDGKLRAPFYNVLATNLEGSFSLDEIGGMVTGVTITTTTHLHGTTVTFKRYVHIRSGIVS